jgi:DDE superfamily endonuclease
VAGDRAHRLELQEQTLGAAERDELARRAWRAEVATWDPAEVVVLDETGAHVALTPACARAPRNARADDRAPCNTGTTLTTLATRTTAGITAAMTVVGAADPLTGEACVRECVVPTLRPGQLLVLDHVRTHQSAELRRLVAAAGCQVRFLPASSPDLSPIEEAFAKVKTLLRRAEARTVEALEVAIGPALDAITPQEARHYFAHCGYGIAKQPCKTL